MALPSDNPTASLLRRVFFSSGWLNYCTRAFVYPAYPCNYTGYQAATVT
jgi:hypothetical protein